VRLTRLIVIACVLAALIAPAQVIAQTSGSYYGTISGTVYSQAFRVSGATVTLWTTTADLVQNQQVDTARTTDSNGEFSFDYVAFKADQQFQYLVRVQKGSDTAYALVYSLPAQGGNDIYVAPLSLDLSTPSGTSEVTATVWSTAGQTTAHTNIAVVPGVAMTLYKYDPASGNKTLYIGNRVTNGDGQVIYSNVPYGMYVVRAEKSGQYGEQTFPAYQQSTSTSVSTNLPIPSPTPTPKPTATPGPSASATPGFEAVAVLVALLGAALYLRKA